MELSSFSTCQKKGNLSKVRVRYDWPERNLHSIGNADSLIEVVGVHLGKRLLQAFLDSGLDVYTRHLRSGLKIEFFEI